MLRRIKVTLDYVHVFDAYTTGAHWCGFACPRFTQKQAERVAEWLRSAGVMWEVAYEEAKDGYCINGEWFYGRDIMKDSQVCLHLYPIGTGSWCWHEVLEVSQ